MTLHEQHEHLLTILRDGTVTTLFQPVVSAVEHKIVGYEALTRGPSNSSLHSPLILFAAARHWGLLTELELLCRRTAVMAFCRLQLEGLLFLNVSPESLLEQQHYPGRTLSIIRELGLPAERVVIELTEHSPIDNPGLLFSALHHYRDMGFSMALDDLGAGYSSLRLWTELQPEFVKIDRHFIDGIHLDPVKREFVGSILNMAKASRAHVIAEGIELPEELSVLMDMGVDWVQGYWLGRPQEVPAVDNVELQKKFIGSEKSIQQEAGLHSLVIPVSAVYQHEKVSDVLQRFQQQPSLNSLAVLDEDDCPVGTIHCHELSQTMLKPYAKELHGRKPISTMIAPDSLIVDVQQSLQRISRLLTSRARQRLEEDFIITEQGRYLGLGRVIDVLRQITELQIRQAQSANPLTLLPGNISIHECLQRLLKNSLTAHVCYIDLDSFKPFNDIYGYGKGDQVLLGLAQILRDLCNDECDFVGHIGGDDFMLVLRTGHWRKQLTELEQRFQRLCTQLYRPEHTEAGGFDAPDREGNWRRHNLISLSIGVVVVPARAGDVIDASRLAELASHNKHEAKKQTGFSIYVTEVESSQSLDSDHLQIA
ncbi:MAG: bifunctional diguanylate cyclase/phosphodiesterase [Pseudohongiella sp.]|nr:bifunctional diguanylate cyclase/phosphodiesterase [Pseudohongiella sp.]MDO9520651.1 bifunctional diguanylate cyclase/phosphodiesterase [Pseudohongiella sp.]MDP2127921.1 bifunctional diguanylate cyclase/phosphodiesterase [Pseudohongiella sp.]